MEWIKMPGYKRGWMVWNIFSNPGLPGTQKRSAVSRGTERVLTVHTSWKGIQTLPCYFLVSKYFWMQKWAPETVFFCLWKASTQVITVIFRRDNLPKIREIPFWNFIWLWAHLVERMTFQYVFLQNTSGRSTEWGILCFRVLPDASRHKQLLKTKYELSRKHFLLSRKAGTQKPTGRQALIINLLSVAHN